LTGWLLDAPAALPTCTKQDRQRSLILCALFSSPQRMWANMQNHY
jgi:hypothetical protein